MQTNASPTFGELLKRFRLAAGLSQEELAGHAGLSPRGVSDLERGSRTNPRPATVRLLAEALRLNEIDRAAFLAAARGMAPSGAPVVAETTTPPDPISDATLLRSHPPIGTVTFLFTDIEGSTRLLQQLGPRYAEVLALHQLIVRNALAAHDGYEVDTQGDSFFVVFPTAPSALAAAIEAARALASHSWPERAVMRVRMGLHSGAPQLVGETYVGLDVHRAARIAAAGSGDQILLSEATAALVRGDLPPGVMLRDLGAHRLKDLQQAEHIYQAVVLGLAGDFPPLKALDAHPHNLPVQTTLLVGRDREVAAICALLRRDDVRVVTLTGPGGIGKTRLSLQVAAEVLDSFLDGVWNVRLSRLTDPRLVVPTLAQTLDLKESGGTHLAEVLRSYLRDKQLLLVLDNFEHVVSAAPEVASLLESSPGVKVLVTSRVPLKVHGEHEYALRPLALPDPQHLPSPDHLSHYAAVALFIERAQAAQADFQITTATAPAVAAICTRLDGLPLAIELAAARVKLLPPPTLLKRLERSLALLTGGARDVDERQQTMRNTLAWSHGLLSHEEQVLFRRLAVFAGGCTLEAAEAVCIAADSVEPLRIDLLECLAALVDHGLVQQREVAGTPRFGMLYVVREYALDQLEASGEAEALGWAHAAYHMAFAERMLAASDEEHDGTASLAYLEQAEQEQDNLRAAFTRLLTRFGATRQRGGTGHANGEQAGESRGVETHVLHGLRLAGTLLWPWAFHGHLSEGRAWVEAFLALAAPAVGLTSDQAAMAGSASPAAQGSVRSAQSASEAIVRARALNAAGVLAYWQGDSDQAVPRLEQSVAIAQAQGDLMTTGVALNNLGMAVEDRGDAARAQTYYEEAQALARALGDTGLMSNTLLNLSRLALTAGDLEQAAILSEEALGVCREMRYPAREAIGLTVQALISWRCRQLSRAATLAREALVLHHTARDERHYGDGLEVCAIVCTTQGRLATAARLLGAAAASRERIGMRRRMSVPTAADIELAMTPARVAHGEQAWQEAFDAGRALSTEAAIAEALSDDVASLAERSD